MTLHIISGFMRSGTTMMMDSCEAGGLLPLYDADIDHWAEVNSERQLFEINPGNRVREPGHLDLGDLDLLEQAAGFNMVVKVLARAVPRFPTACGVPIRVLMMTRHPAEIRVSARAALGHDAPVVSTGVYDRLETTWLKRGANKVIRFSYPDVVAAPLEHMVRLEAAGWPIDPHAAAKVPDDDWYRHRFDPNAPVRSDRKQLGVDVGHETDPAFA